MCLYHRYKESYLFISMVCIENMRSRVNHYPKNINTPIDIKKYLYIDETHLLQRTKIPRTATVGKHR